MASENPFLQHAAPQIAGLTPYVPGKPVSELEREFGITDSVKLASNENPLGCGDLARAAFQACAEELGRYPDGGAFALRGAIAEHHGLDAAQVTVGNGSNDVLDLIARTFLYPGRESVFSEHAFAVYAISTQAVGATPRIADAKDFGHDLDALAALVNERTSVVWIANPNNPTGYLYSREELEVLRKIVLKHDLFLFSDEVYREFLYMFQAIETVHRSEISPMKRDIAEGSQKISGEFQYNRGLLQISPAASNP